MTAVGEWRATYAPGDWLVLCGPTSVVVLEPPGAGWTELVAELWEQVLAASSLRDLAARLAAYGLDSMPSFGALFWTPDGMRSLVRGSVRVVDPGTGGVVADGDGMQTWSEVGLAHLRTARLETAGEDDPDPLLLPLVVGAVRASSVVLDAGPDVQLDSPQLDLAEVATSRTDGEPDPDTGTDTDVEESLVLPTTEAMAAPAPASEPRATGVASDLDGDEAPTEPQLGPAVPGAAPALASAGPVLLGVRCPSGHPNPPGSERCRDCGVRIVETEPRPVPQPVLAILRVSDGTELALDRLVRVGRAPVERDGVVARLLTVPSPGHDISRTHLEIAPKEWRVFVKDLNSTNGTMLVSSDGAHRRALPPGEAVPVALGSVLELAEGVSVLLDHPQ